LSAAAARPRRHPAGRGSVVHRRGARPPAGRVPGAVLQQGPASHPIAPSEFPKGPSAAPRSSAGALPHGVA
jgi:hypothetical protein